MSAERRPQIALVAREVAPLFGGGIGTYVASMAELLEAVGEVTVFTTDRHRPAYERLTAAGDRRLAAMRIRFVAEAREWELEDYNGSAAHLWSARAYEALCAAYPDGGPELAEFPDFLGEGFVTAQAVRAQDPRLRRTTVCLRLCTTTRMTDVLNGHLPAEFAARVTHEIERYALAHCDHVLWPGGDVLASYERVYGRGEIADPRRVRHPLALEPQPAAAADRDDDELRLLYLGRLERRKGVLDLARAMTGVEAPNLRLTMLGADTPTAPLGQSMRELLDQILCADSRVEFRDAVAPDEVSALFDAHDLIVMPSLWECWPAVGMEALARNRPLLATPTGGFTEIVEQGRSGWLTDAPGAEPLARKLEELAAAPGEVRSLIATGGPSSHFAELNDLDEVRADYAELAGSKASRRGAPRRAGGEPLVSIVIPYYRLARHVEETVRSAAEQTHANTELILVNDGSFDAADAIVAELASRYPLAVITQANSGLGAARNLGATQARGSHVMFLDADNVARPTFVARCLETLEADASLAYATSWARYIDERGAQWAAAGRGLRPLGNWSELVEERNVAGDAAALFRRELFDAGLRFSQELTSFEDWALYRQLRREGRFGHVIPEVLLDYRIRGDSMMRRLGSPNADRIEGEVRAHLAEAAIEWTMDR